MKFGVGGFANKLVMGEFTFSKVLFVNDDGGSMKFRMVSSKYRNKLKPYIEYGGGAVTNKDSEDAIRLAHPGQRVHSDDLIHTRYIMDCVIKNKLLDLDKYRLKSGDTAEDSTDEWDTDQETTGPIIIQGEAKDKKGRRKYLLSEDMAIIKHLLNEKLYNDHKGNVIWRNLGRLEITPHPWQSMKDRFKKYILPNIGQYSLTPQEVATLTGSLPEADIQRIIKEVKGQVNSPSKKTQNKSLQSPSEVRSPSRGAKPKLSDDQNADGSGSSVVSPRPGDLVHSDHGDPSMDKFDQELLNLATTTEEVFGKGIIVYSAKKGQSKRKSSRLSRVTSGVASHEEESDQGNSDVTLESTSATTPVKRKSCSKNQSGDSCSEESDSDIPSSKIGVTKRRVGRPNKNSQSNSPVRNSPVKNSPVKNLSVDTEDDIPLSKVGMNSGTEVTRRPVGRPRKIVTEVIKKPPGRPRKISQSNLSAATGEESDVPLQDEGDKSQGDKSQGDDPQGDKPHTAVTPNKCSPTNTEPESKTRGKSASVSESGSPVTRSRGRPKRARLSSSPDNPIKSSVPVTKTVQKPPQNTTQEDKEDREGVITPSSRQEKSAGRSKKQASTDTNKEECHGGENKQRTVSGENYLSDQDIFKTGKPQHSSTLQDFIMNDSSQDVPDDNHHGNSSSFSTEYPSDVVDKDLIVRLKDIAATLDIDIPVFVDALFKVNGNITDAINWLLGEPTKEVVWSKDEDKKLSKITGTLTESQQRRRQFLDSFL